MGNPAHFAGQGIDWPATIQAVGSVVAIVATGALFILDKRNRDAESKAKAKELARTVGQMALHSTNTVTARLSSALEPKVLFALRGHQTTEMVQAMRELEMTELSPEIVKHFAYVRSGIYAVNARISDVYDSEKRDGRKIAARRTRLMSAGRVLHQTLLHLENLHAAIGEKFETPKITPAVHQFMADALAETESSEEARLD